MTDTHTQLRNSLDAPLVDPEFIGQKHKALFVCATAVLNAEAGLPAEVKSPADLEALTKHAKDARSARQNLDTARTGEKKRFDDAGKEVQALFTPRMAKLDASGKVALDRITAYNRRVEEEQRVAAAEAARAAREEADRRMAAAASVETKGLGDVAETILDSAIDAQDHAEHLDRVATGSAADLVRTQTAAGTVTSATTLTFEVTDWPTLRATFGPLADHFDAASIEKAIRSYLRAEKKAGRAPSLAGVRFYEEKAARVR